MMLLKPILVEGMIEDEALWLPMMSIHSRECRLGCCAALHRGRREHGRWVRTDWKLKSAMVLKCGRVQPIVKGVYYI